MEFTANSLGPQVLGEFKAVARPSSGYALLFALGRGDVCVRHARVPASRPIAGSRGSHSYLFFAFSHEKAGALQEMAHRVYLRFVKIYPDDVTTSLYHRAIGYG